MVQEHELTASEANAEATALLREGRADEGLVIIEKILSSKADQLSTIAKSTLLANRGLCLEQVGRLDEAVDSVEEAVQVSKGRNDAAKDVLRQLKASQLMARAVEKAAKNEFSNALAMFQEAGRLDPEGDGVWRYNVAVMLNKLGRTKESLTELLGFKERLEHQGQAGGTTSDDEEEDKVNYLPLLGELLCKEKQWKEAVEAIDHAIAKNLELPASLLYNYGVALLRTSQLAKARSAFDDVVAYYPNYGLAYDALASIDAQEGAAHCQRKEFSEAIPKLYAAVQRTPKTSTLYNLGLALLRERRAPEAKEQFEHLLRMDTKNKSAKQGLEAAELMIESGEYKEKPVVTNASTTAEYDSDQHAEYDTSATMPSPSIAPQKRIYQIAVEKGVGSLATSDDMVMLLSGIEEWVASALGPLEQRVVALELAAEAAGGIVGSASEDRAVLQMLFDRVATLEEQGYYSGAQDDDDYYAKNENIQYNGEEEAQYHTREEDQLPVASGDIPPQLAKQFDTAALSRKLAQVNMGSEGLDRRLKALEKMLLGNATAAHPQKSAFSGSGLLADDDEEDDASKDEASQQISPPVDDTTSMSLVARLAIQEQRFVKMSTEMEQQNKEIQKLKDQLTTMATSARPLHPLMGGGGGGGQANFKITKGRKSGESGANVGNREMPNMLTELKNATKKRAQKRREMGLTLQE